MGDIQIRFVVAPMGFGVQTLSRDGVLISVTDRERTLVDGCDRPQYSGGLEEFLRSVESFPSVDHMPVLDYVRRYPRKSVAAKVGWVLDRFDEQGDFPEDVRKEVQTLRPQGAVIFEPAPRKRLASEWGVLVPRSLKPDAGKRRCQSIPS